MKDLAERLIKVNEEIFEKFGTESYELRCKIYDIHKELQKQGQALPIDNVSDIFPPLNTVRQEIDKYNDSMQNDKGHFQNGINWAFNYIAKKVNK